MGGLLMPMEIVRQLPYDHPYRWDGTLFGGPKLWRPNALAGSLALWLDAEDTASITLNGTTVSQWADKSGNGRNAAQSTAANQPTFATSGIFGKPSLGFDGNDLMSGTWSPATASQATVAVVCSYGVSTTTSAAASIGTNSANSGLGIGWNATFTRYNSFLWGVNEGSLSSAFTSNPVIQIGLLSSTEVAQSFNGVLNQAAIGSPATISTAYQVGAINGVLPLSAASRVAEVVILNVSASTDNRQRLEGYLAWKWGLEANLPSNHPYKLLPPTV